MPPTAHSGWYTHDTIVLGIWGWRGSLNPSYKKSQPSLNPRSCAVHNADALLSSELARASLNHSTAVRNVKGGSGQTDTPAVAHEPGRSRRGQEGGLV